MKAPKPSKALIIKSLEKDVRDLSAQLLSTRIAALKNVKNAGGNLMASAAVIEIRALGGGVIVEQVAINDGLSAATIACLEADIRRSIDLSVSFVPKIGSEKDDVPK